MYVSETVDSRVVRCRMGSKRLEQAAVADLPLDTLTSLT